MQITDPISNPRLFIEQTKADALQQLQPGQVVRAVVEAPVDKGVAQLNIGGVKLPVKTGLRLEVGQQLVLAVVKSGRAPELRVVRETTPAITRTLALKDILPRQLPLIQLLDSLKSLASLPQTSVNGAGPETGPAPAAAKEQPLASLIRQLSQQMTTDKPAGSTPLERNLQLLVDALRGQPGQAVRGNNDSSTGVLARQINRLINQLLPGGTPVSGAAIRQSLTESGLFLEAHLLNRQSTGNDFKEHLLRLLQALQPLQAAPTGDPAGKAADPGTTLQLLAARLFAELQHQAEGALARVQLHQLASLPQDENSHKQLWQFELPIAHPEGHDEFLIQFEREARPAAEAGDRWSVMLNFNIPPTGPVRARLSLIADEISSHFTAEDVEGACRIEQLLPTLYEAFSRAGLKVGKLTAAQGVAVSRPDQPVTPLPLLDERA
ncbi:flagellar hook-length control protein FliK [Sedimenticola hydrogenitrophicus]|uniref:flagellar hook-length control protein FliK n=1 Tax=Sedimenticola hydrogenitrophicus TaxID=2967975 RepID=UPI0023B15716|nr:flagellar hook-length control protein FliK [Sedimenticola hydrogenitrophicus]